MDTNNKPEVTADPAASTPAISSEEALHQRIQEVREQQTPITPEELVKKGEVAKSSGGQPDVDGAQESSSNGDEANVAALKLIEASTGRKFNSTEEAQKFLTNLNSLVGDQSLAKGREAAKVLDTLSAKLGKPASELTTYVDTLVAIAAKPEAKPAEARSASDPRLLEKVERLEDFEQRLQLERKYPQSVEVVDEVSLVAKAKGISYVEAFEQSRFKELLEIKAKEEQAKNPVVTPSNKTKINTQSVAELGQKLMTGKGREADAVKFIEELGLGA